MTPIITIQEVEALVEAIRRTPMSIAEGLFFTALFSRLLEALTAQPEPPAK